MTAHAEAMGAPAARPLPAHAHLRAARRCSSCAARAPGCGTRTARRYLDLLSGLAVTSLGHSHPAVAAALHEQAQTLLHVSNLFGTDVGLAGGPHPRPPARRRASPAGPTEGTRGQVFFANSGAEANECALKLARRFGGRGRHVVVSAFGSFHGRTLATLHATGQPAKHEAFQPLPEGFRHVAWNDLDALEAALDPSVAAVLLEPVQGEGGVNPATAEYFQGVRRLCDERGDPLHGRRGADRPRPLRRLVRPPAPRRRARRRHHGQGARQRRAHRRLLGQDRGRGRVRAGRPRHHLRRPAPGHRRRPRRARGDGGRGRPRPRRAGRRSAHRRAPRRCPGSPRCAASGCCSPSSSTATTARTWPPGSSSSAPSSTPSRPRPCAWLRRLLITDDEIDHAVDLLAEALAMTPPCARDRRPDRRRGGARCSTWPRTPTRPPLLAGQTVGLYFEKPSLRTRHSCETAVVQLGGHPVTFRGRDRRRRAASRSATSPGSCPATTPRSAPGCSTTASSSSSPRRRRSRWSTCCPTPATRASRSPTCSRCGRSGGRWTGARSPGSATSTTSPAAWRSAPR